MSMRIATFNLESLDDRPGIEPALEERIAQLRPQLARLEADILCLQEINAQRQGHKAPRSLHALDRLLRETAYEAYSWTSSATGEPDALAEKHNLVILSRWPIVDRQVIRHNLVPGLPHRYVTADPAEEGALLTWDRPILKATIALPEGPPLHLFNLHLRAPLASPVPGGKLDQFAWRSVGAWAEGYFLSVMKRCGQALEARLAIERLFERDPNALVAVCGDFNAVEWASPLRILRGEVEDTGNEALGGRTLVLLEHGLPESRRFSVVHGGRPIMLDHILSSRALFGHFRHIEAHNETLADELTGFATGRPPSGSFHAPLVAEFALETARGK